MTDYAEVYNARALLILAHPGHELRLYGWLSFARPDVMILTDGSGWDGKTRTSSSRRVLEEVSAAPSDIFGRYTDKQIYRALIGRDKAFFIDIASELAAVVQANAYGMIVTDPCEGYNPVHDLCSVLSRTALAAAAPSLHKTVVTYDYPLMNPGLFGPEDEVQTIRLTQAMLERKLAAALRYEEISDEVDRALVNEGIASQGAEYLRRTRGRNYSPVAPPFYETYGEKQRAAGRYTEVIRYRDHFLPVTETLSHWSNNGCAAARR